MGKTYKVITCYGRGIVYIDNYATLEDAQAAYNKACEDKCEFCYLLKTGAYFATTGDSVNKILKIYKCE